ncbi:MAG: ABC transporter ATP-binding protein [Alphaproteobacteria bacterium]|nr:ABC transporter ATP-binding protein [Alphaproteobacteria bacterium]
MARVELDNVSFSVGDIDILVQVKLTVEDGECLALLGPSGCGKTTTLRAIAGFVEPTAGDVRVDGRSVLGMRPNKRNVGLVFQDYALFPHMNVEENVAYGLRRRRVARETIGAKVAEMLTIVRLEGMERRMPNELSGGQRQRVALGRALVIEPDVLLLDEPLGALDRLLRDQMQVELKRIHKELGITTIIVTHDQEEALSLSDRVAVMFDGRIVEIGTPAQLYAKPDSRGVMEFLGASNIFSGSIAARDGDRIEAECDGFRVAAAGAPVSGKIGEPVQFGVRPEHIRVLAAKPTETINVVAGTVAESVYKGTHTEIYVTAESGQEFMARLHSEGRGANLDFAKDARVYLRFDSGDMLTFRAHNDAQTGKG